MKALKKKNSVTSLASFNKYMNYAIQVVQSTTTCICSCVSTQKQQKRTLIAFAKSNESLLLALLARATRAKYQCLIALRRSKRSMIESLQYIGLEYNILIVRVQYILSLNLLLRLLSCNPLLLSNCLHCLKTLTNLFNSIILSNISHESTSVTILLEKFLSKILVYKNRIFN